MTSLMDSPYCINLIFQIDITVTFTARFILSFTPQFVYTSSLAYSVLFRQKSTCEAYSSRGLIEMGERERPLIVTWTRKTRRKEWIVGRMWRHQSSSQYCLDQSFSTNGSRHGSGLWKISNGSWNSFPKNINVCIIVQNKDIWAEIVEI